jgi:hypothetical protein
MVQSAAWLEEEGPHKRAGGCRFLPLDHGIGKVGQKYP